MYFPQYHWQTVPTSFDLFQIVAYFLVQGQNELPFDCRFLNCNRILSLLLINVLIFHDFPASLSFLLPLSVWAATQPILTHTHTQRNAEGTKIVIRFGKFSICPNVAAFCGVWHRGGGRGTLKGPHAQNFAAQQYLIWQGPKKQKQPGNSTAACNPTQIVISACVCVLPACVCVCILGFGFIFAFFSWSAHVAVEMLKWSFRKRACVAGKRGRGAYLQARIVIKLPNRAQKQAEKSTMQPREGQSLPSLSLPLSIVSCCNSTRLVSTRFSLVCFGFSSAQFSSVCFGWVWFELIKAIKLAIVLRLPATTLLHLPVAVAVSVFVFLSLSSSLTWRHVRAICLIYSVWDEVPLFSC